MVRRACAPVVSCGVSTQSERKALIFLAAVACLGLGARVARSRGDAALAAAGSTAAIDGQLRAVDSARRAERGARGGKGSRRPARRRTDSLPDGAEPRTRTAPVSAQGASESLTRPWIVGRMDPGGTGIVVPGSAHGPGPTAHGPPIDLDRASAAEIERLPGIGPALAGRIVADREAHGAFGSLEALTGVPGIGKRMAERLAPSVTFSGPRRPLNAVPAGASDGSEKRRRGRARAGP